MIRPPKYGAFILQWMGCHPHELHTPKEVLAAYETEEGPCDRAEFYHELRLYAKFGFIKRIQDRNSHNFYAWKGVTV